MIPGYLHSDKSGYCLLVSAMILVLMFPSISVAQDRFKNEQFRYPRVRAAFEEKESILKTIISEKGLQWPPENILIIIFKHEREVELWAVSDKNHRYRLIRKYEICDASGTLGPKRRQGDLQVPEGFYYIDRFNPGSKFYLSLGINYPNASDKILGVQGKLGGDIFIHGNCVSIGCVAIRDEFIKELYLIAVEARSNGQKRIPIYIFPAKMDEDGMKRLKKSYAENRALLSFWENLKKGHDFFQQNRILPVVTVNENGRYIFSDPVL